MAAVVASAATARHAIKQADAKQIQPELVKLFEEYDTDKDGYITKSQVKHAVSRHVKEHKIGGRGCHLAPAKFKKAMKTYGVKPDCVTMDERGFKSMCYDLRANPKEFLDDPPPEPYSDSCRGDKKLPYQDEVFYFYNHSWVVSAVALVIVANFLVNIVEKEIDPDPNNSQYPDFWATCDTTFNIIFIIELTLNIWSHGGPVAKFWASGWNVFDTIIVTVGFLTMVNALGPPLDQLKLLRAFRVFRLFKRVESLNKIIVALIGSIPGVANAFLVMLIFFCIYAILAVELFRDFGSEGVYVTFNELGENVSISAETGRGLNIGLEYYGTFMRALYTLFQVMTGESWSEAIARPLLFGFSDSLTVSAIITGVFFVSFIILTQLVLINVVVAVLLDKFVDQPGSAEPEEPPKDEMAEESAVTETQPNQLPAPAVLPAPKGAAAGAAAADPAVIAKLDSLLASVAGLTTTVNEQKRAMTAMQEEIKKLSEVKTKQVV